jgi:hypothetical protein
VRQNADAGRHAPDNRRALGQPRGLRGHEVLALAVHEHHFDEMLLQHASEPEALAQQRAALGYRHHLEVPVRDALLDDALRRAGKGDLVAALGEHARRGGEDARATGPLAVGVIEECAHLL